LPYGSTVCGHIGAASSCESLISFPLVRGKDRMGVYNNDVILR